MLQHHTTRTDGSDKKCGTDKLDIQKITTFAASFTI
jgi:hypothetical protein